MLSSALKITLWITLLARITLLTQIAMAQSVSAPSAMKVTDATIYNLISSSGTAVSVAGFDPIKVVVSTTSGTLKITTTSGLTAPTGYTTLEWAGSGEIGFSGSLSNVNNALATLQLLGTGTITVSPTSPTVVYSSVTGNFYEKSTTTKNFADAKADAESKSINGASGYLATVTSTAEFDYIKSKAGLSSGIWLGASDSAVEGEWRWIGGPENGQQFWQGDFTGFAVNGMWNDWNPGEPNDSSGEDYLQITTGGKLNDLNGTQLLSYVVEYTGASVATSVSFLVALQDVNDPDYAFDQVSNDVARLQEAERITLSKEYIQENQNLLDEKMTFHSEMLRADSSTVTSSFVNYAINFAGNGQTESGTGWYNQTNVIGDLYRRRVVIDAKKIYSKNGKETKLFSTSVLYDLNIAKTTSQQYRFGVKINDGDGVTPFPSTSIGRSARAGFSLSHSFSNQIFGGIFIDLNAGKIESKYITSRTIVTSELNTYSLSGGAALRGQYQVNPTFWIKPTFSMSYIKDNLIKKSFMSKTSTGSMLLDTAIYLPTITRIAFSPKAYYESLKNKAGVIHFLSLNPSYSCETVRTRTKINRCNMGVDFDVGLKNYSNQLNARVYLSHENLGTGPKNEFGVQAKLNF